VTVATSGIGTHIARQLAAQGRTVLVGARDADRGREVADQVGGHPLPLDVTDADSIASVEVFRRTYETNVFGVAAVTNAFVLVLRRSAHPRIVNLSSGTGSLTWSTAPNPQFDYQAAATGSGAAYRSSKTALNALTVFYAQALAGDGINVNALAPGLRAINLNARAGTAGGDPAEAAAAEAPTRRPRLVLRRLSRRAGVCADAGAEGAVSEALSGHSRLADACSTPGPIS
jgi:NAD(P)-dependent dehydrogenase (short-subunit alcohol dehydrogenase family)